MARRSLRFPVLATLVVPTPGSDDRGARRIVTGADGEMYWTADHYDSFSWIER
jgi:ribonuclease T1